MAELELELRELGARLAYPATPDLSAAVGARIAEPRRRAGRRSLALGLALAAVALGIAFAVPPARTAILRFFHVGSVTVERVEKLPPAQQRPLTTGLGRELPRREAERVAGFSLPLPPLSHPPRRFYARDGLVATILRVHGRPVLLAALRGELGFAKKFAGPKTTVSPTTVLGHPGIWLAGGGHVLLFVDSAGAAYSQPTRLAGNVLVWERGQLTMRLEGRIDEAEALRLARSIR